MTRIKLAGRIGAGLVALALAACNQETEMTTEATAADTTTPTGATLIERARGIEAPRAEQRRSRSNNWVSPASTNTSGSRTRTGSR